MLAIRTLGSRVFDRINKGVLLDISFLMTAVGYLALSLTTESTPIIPIALLFGAGLGLGFPALNSLMFIYSEPRFRALNANLMMLALHMGYFIGPILGGSLVNHNGYTGFLLTWMALNLGAFTFCALLLRDPRAAKKTTDQN